MTSNPPIFSLNMKTEIEADFSGLILALLTNWMMLERAQRGARRCIHGSMHRPRDQDLLHMGEVPIYSHLDVSFWRF